MKSVGLLLCLALAGATASIFRRTPNTEGLIVEPLDYIPQYQLPIYQQYQQTFEELQKPEHNNKDHHHHHHSTSSSQENSHQSHESHESHESKEKKSEEKHYADSHHDSKYWKQFTFVKKDGEMVPVHGDPMVWKGLSIAVGPHSVIKTTNDMEKIFGNAEQIVKHVGDDQKAKFHEALTAAIKNDNEDAHLNATQLIKKHQYTVEEHTVNTDDGYHLTLFRIPPKTAARDVLKKPVMLMHDLLGSADDWLLQGPENSLAYLLADAGHDVWLGNVRGNKYSRHHASKHPALKDFWKFSNDEIALHDLPTMIDHALQTSGEDKLHYIGHGQGTTTFFALASEKPEYNDKIITMHALSPMAYMSNVRSPLFRMIAPTSSFYDRLHEQFGHGAFKPSNELVHTIGGAMCQNTVGCDNICSNVNFVISGVDVETMDPEMTHVIMGHLPAGTSTRVIKHYGQGVASHEFRKYDYGTETNKQVYGTAEPPKYEMQKVYAPVSLYFSEEDWLAHPKDVGRLLKELPNVMAVHKVPEKHFTHMDFQFSKKAPETVFKKVMEIMQTPSN